MYVTLATIVLQMKKIIRFDACCTVLIPCPQLHSVQKISGQDEENETATVPKRTPVFWIATIGGGVLVLAVVLSAVAVVLTKTQAPKKTNGAAQDAADCDAALETSHVFHPGFCAKHSSAARLPFRKLTGDAMSLLTLGDFGRDGLCCQNDVAMEMALASDQLPKTRNILSMGDNFYPTGLQ